MFSQVISFILIIIGLYIIYINSNNLYSNIQTFTTIYNSNNQDVKIGQNNLINISGNINSIDTINSPSGENCVMYDFSIEDSRSDIYNNMSGKVYQKYDLGKFEIIDKNDNRFTIKSDKFNFIVENQTINNYTTGIMDIINDLDYNKDNTTVEEGTISENDNVNIYGSVNFINKQGENILKPVYYGSAVISNMSREYLIKSYILSITKYIISIMFMLCLCISLFIYKFPVL